jgi:hypothetical protein
MQYSIGLAEEIATLAEVGNILTPRLLDISSVHHAVTDS